MKIYLCGQKHFGAETFRALCAQGHELVGVSAPVGSSSGILDRLRGQATMRDIPLTGPGELSEAALPPDVDLIVAAHSHDFIGERVRNCAKYGAIGYHPSLLPLHRGRDAVKWVIRMNERVTGGTVYWLSDRVDGGPIAAQEHVFVRRGDSAEILWRRDLAPLGVRLLVRVCGDIERGQLNRTFQDEALATWEPTLNAIPLNRTR